MDANNNTLLKEETFSDCTLSMFEDETMCDVTLIAGEQKEEIQAHKFILVRCSEVFKVMFSSTFSESSGKVEVPDIEPDILRLFLRYLYSGRLENLTWNKVISLLYIAEKYAVHSLSYRCDLYLQQSVSQTNIWTLLNQATLYNMKDLLRQCLLYSSIKGQLIVESEEFLSLTRDSIQALLKSEYFTAEDHLIYMKCIKWAEDQCKKDSLETSEVNVRKCLGPILGLIRFNCMKVKTFASVVSTENILTADEKIAMFQAISSKSDAYKKFNLCTAPPRKIARQFHCVSFFSFDITKTKNYVSNMFDSIMINFNKELELLIVLLLLPVKESDREFSGYVTLIIRQNDRVLYNQRCPVIASPDAHYGRVYIHPSVTLEAQTNYILSVKCDFATPMFLYKSKGREEKMAYAGLKMSLQKVSYEQCDTGAGGKYTVSTIKDVESSFFGVVVV